MNTILPFFHSSGFNLILFFVDEITKSLECLTANLRYAGSRRVAVQVILIFPAQKDEHHQGANPYPRDSALECIAALGLLVK